VSLDLLRATTGPCLVEQPAELLDELEVAVAVASERVGVTVDP